MTSLNKNDIELILEKITGPLSSTFWIVGGSAALVLQGYLETANDIDIVQHSGPRVNLNTEYETRMWSRLYGDLQVDLHYSNPFNTQDYNRIFDKFIAAIDYIDSQYNEMFKKWRVATPTGAGLINWVHHFLEYGFNPARTISPGDNDEKHLKEILTPDAYDTIKWKVEMNKIEQPGVHLAFEEYALKNLPKI